MSSFPNVGHPVPIENEPASSLDRSGIGGQPRGLTTLFFTEMWERFSYYGMRALLILYMTKAAADGGLGFETKRAALIYGTYTMSVYLLSILGGFIADNFIGARRAVLIGGIVIATGHFSMACTSHFTFFAGLVLITLGTGLLKPNISTMVGSLYSATDARRDAGFSIFYMGINIGALISPLVTGYLAQDDSWKAHLAAWGLDPRHSWHWGFAAAGVGMTLGLVMYLLQQDRLAAVGNAPAAHQPRPWAKLGVVGLASLILIAAMMLCDGGPWIWLGNFVREKLGINGLASFVSVHPHLGHYVVGLLFAIQIAAVIFFAFRPDEQSKRIAAILVFFFAAEIFWAIFEQAGSSMSLFADQLTDNRLLGWSFPSSWWQSVNSAWVIALAPVFAWLWIKLGARQPSSPVKFTLGLLFVALSFVWMIPAARLVGAGKVSPIWLLGLYFFQTVGEMCLSPVGLSTMAKLAPQRLLGLVMGIWFLADALGSKLAGVLASDFTSEDPGELVTFFSHQAIGVGVATLVLFALVPWTKKLMGGVK